MIITNPLSFKAYQSITTIGTISLEIVDPVFYIYNNEQLINLDVDISRLNEELISQYTALFCLSFGHEDTENGNIQWQSDEEIYNQEIPESIVTSSSTSNDIIHYVIPFDNLVDYATENIFPVANNTHLRFGVAFEPLNGQEAATIRFSYSNEVAYQIS